MDFTEIEEALVLVKQRKEREEDNLDFLHKVSDEKNKGKRCDFCNVFTFMSKCIDFGSQHSSLCAQMGLWWLSSSIYTW